MESDVQVQSSWLTIRTHLSNLYGHIQCSSPSSNTRLYSVWAGWWSIVFQSLKSLVEHQLDWCPALILFLIRFTLRTLSASVRDKRRQFVSHYVTLFTQAFKFLTAFIKHTPNFYLWIKKALLKSLLIFSGPAK